MRMLLALTLLLLTCSSLAQNSASADFKKTFPPDRFQGQMDFKPLADTGKVWAQPPDPNLARCFFIRSYNFERRGTEAPRLKNMTTCTPASGRQLRRTQKSPQVRLIPAN